MIPEFLNKDKFEDPEDFLDLLNYLIVKNPNRVSFSTVDCFEEIVLTEFDCILCDEVIYILNPFITSPEDYLKHQQQLSNDYETNDTINLTIIYDSWKEKFKARLLYDGVVNEFVIDFLN